MVFTSDILWGIMGEQQPIGISESQRKLGKIDQALGKADRVSHSIGTPEFGRPELDISSSSQLDRSAFLDAAIKVGRVRKALAENAVPTLTDLKNQIQGQINDPDAAKNEEKLKVILQLVDTGYLSPTVLKKDRVPVSANETSGQPVLTLEFAVKLRREFLGRLPDDVKLSDLGGECNRGGVRILKEEIPEIRGWRALVDTLGHKRKMQLSRTINALNRLRISTIGDIRKLGLENQTLPGLGDRSVQFLINAFQKSPLVDRMPEDTL